MNKAADTPKAPVRTFKALLEGPPSATAYAVNDVFRTQDNGVRIICTMSPPPIELYCDSEACDGVRFFRCGHSLEPVVAVATERKFFLTYRCGNCGLTRKDFALQANWVSFPPESTKLIKYGEVPSWGPPTPNRLRKMLDEANLALFLKGRRCESQSLGIGAFGYYRRVVEDQKNAMIDAIVSVAARIGSDKELIADLQAAKKETQFTKAIELIKHGIPSSLLIDGHNPLTLLHSALSEGLHAKSDSDCLELATSVRLVMTELAGRLTAALQDHKELNAAIGRLSKRREDKS